MSNIKDYIPSIAYFCIFLLVIRIVYDLIISYITYKGMKRLIADKKCKILNERFVYGDIPGQIIINYTAEDFIKKYKNQKIDVIDYNKFFANNISCTIIGPGYICINNIIIDPVSYFDYLEILKYICKYLLITHNIKKETKKSDPIFFENFYHFMYNLKKDNPFGDNVKDIIVFDMMPQKYSEYPFIYYDTESKIVYCYGFMMSPFVEMIILSYFNPNIDRKLDLFLNTESYRKLDLYKANITKDIYEYVKNKPYNQTYTVSVDVDEDNIIEKTLSIITENYNNESELIKYLHNWKSNNYATSFWDSLPSQIELEYEEMFNKDINS